MAASMKPAMKAMQPATKAMKPATKAMKKAAPDSKGRTTRVGEDQRVARSRVEDRAKAKDRAAEKEKKTKRLEEEVKKLREEKKKWNEEEGEKFTVDFELERDWKELGKEIGELIVSGQRGGDNGPGWGKRRVIGDNMRAWAEGLVVEWRRYEVEEREKAPQKFGKGARSFAFMGVKEEASEAEEARRDASASGAVVVSGQVG